MLPEVTIMMPVYNGMPHIEASIKSILNQTYTNWICIICDDGSTDSTSAYLQSLTTDPRFTILTNSKNMGRGISRQRILDASTGKYVCMLDAGDMMHPDRIRIQVEYLENHPDVGLVSSGMLSFGTQTDLLRVRGFGNNQINTYSGNGSVCFAPSMFRTSIAKENNVTFGTLNQCEDTYFLTRYYRHNPQYYSIPKTLYYYNEFDGFSKRDTLMSYLQQMVIGLQAKDIKTFALNLAKFGVSLIILPFISMQKRAAKRGRPATPEETAEFNKLAIQQK